MSVLEKLKSGASVVALATVLTVTPLTAEDLTDQTAAVEKVEVARKTIEELVDEGQLQRARPFPK